MYLLCKRSYILPCYRRNTDSYTKLIMSVSIKAQTGSSQMPKSDELGLTESSEVGRGRWTARICPILSSLISREIWAGQSFALLYFTSGFWDLNYFTLFIQHKVNLPESILNCKNSAAAKIHKHTKNYKPEEQEKR